MGSRGVVKIALWVRNKYHDIALNQAYFINQKVVYLFQTIIKSGIFIQYER